MVIRFGYVAIALEIPEGSPNKTVTATNLLKLSDSDDRISRLRRLTRTNIENQLRVLRYNRGHQIHVFRFTSKLVPLATHPISSGWDYFKEFSTELEELGAYIKENNMRVSAHPDHFSLLNSPKDEVIAASLTDLNYHAGLFDTMGLGDEAKLVLHVGGLYKDKEQALERFRRNFQALPDNIKNRIILENDDKSYTAKDVLNLCRELNIPMVLDVHHHECCNDGQDIRELLPGIFATWSDMPPKIHFSSPKDAKNIRAHADYIKAEDFIKFLDIAKEIGNADFDVMIEAKQKDRALHTLMKDLENVPGVKILEQAAIEY